MNRKTSFLNVEHYDHLRRISLGMARLGSVSEMMGSVFGTGLTVLICIIANRTDGYDWKLGALGLLAGSISIGLGWISGAALRVQGEALSHILEITLKPIATAKLRKMKSYEHTKPHREPIPFTPLKGSVDTSPNCVHGLNTDSVSRD
jgi:hypothetical protein